MIAFSPADTAQAGGVAVLLGEGSGMFQPPRVTMLSGGLVQQGVGSALSAPLAVGDVNGHRRPDVVTVVGGASSNQAAVLLPDLVLADCCGLHWSWTARLAVIGQVQEPVQGTFSAAPTLTPSQTQQFTVTGYFGSSTAGTWSLDSPVGTISAAGLYTAPPSITTQQAVNVIAASVSNTNYAAFATIALSPPPTQYQLTITASPAPAWSSDRCIGRYA